MSSSVNRPLVWLVLVALVASVVVALDGRAADAAETGRLERRVGTLDVVRYAGQTRTDTAALLATDDAVDAPAFDGDAVLVARADAFPDSLAGSYLAGVMHAPVLLTNSAEPSPEMMQALATLQPEDVVILGGTAAVSATVEDALAVDHGVVRIAGADRYETAARIARHSGPSSHPGLAIVASGETFPDALAAGAVAAGEHLPLLLTAGGALPAPTAAALEDLGITDVLLMGGTAAVSSAVESQIGSLGITVERVWGADRFETARRIGELATTRFGWRTDHVNLTNGLRFPDAVALAAHAGLEAGGPAPIALTAGSLPAATAAWLRDLAACDFASVHVAGGAAAVADDVADAAIAAVRPDGCSDDAPPTVSFTSPGDGAVIQRTPQGIRLTGTADDADSGVRTVEIVVDGVRRGATVGDRSTSPLQWSIDLTPPEDRTYTFTAIATDGAGQTATDSLTITIEGWDAGATIVNDDVQVLDQGPDASDGDTLIFGTPPADPPLPGEILVAGVLPGLPQGLLRRVVTAETDDAGRLIVITAPAQMTDVFMKADVTFETPVSPSSGAVVTPEDGVTIVPTEDTPGLPGSDKVPAHEEDVRTGPRSDFCCAATTVTTASSDTSAAKTPQAARERQDVEKRFDKNWKAEFDKTFASGALRIQGANTFGVWLEFKLRIVTDWDWFNTTVRVDVFRVVGGADESLEITATAGADLSVEKTVPLGKIELPPITFAIAFVPVVITTDLTLDLALSASAVGQASAGASASIGVSAGVQYTHANGWEPVSSLDREFSVQPLQFQARVEAEAALEAGLGAALYDAAVVRIVTGPYIGASAATDRDPFWSIVGGFRGKVSYSVQVPIIDKTLGGADQPLFDLQWPLATSDDFPDAGPTEPEQPAVQITSPTVDGGTYGCCELLLRADPYTPQEGVTRLYTQWSSAQDGSLGASRNRQPLRVSLDPGIHDITAEVTAPDGNGDPVTVTDTIRVVIDSSRFSDQLGIVSVVGGDLAGAATLAQTLSGGDPLVIGAEFLQAPPTSGFAAVVHDAPGFPVGPLSGTAGKGLAELDRRAVLLTTGAAADAVTRNQPDETGTDLGGGAFHGDSSRDVTELALYLDVPEHANCAVLDHRFLSEEVPRFIGTTYNDAFVIERFDATVKNAAVSLQDADHWTVSGSEITSPVNRAFGPEGLPVRVNAATSEFTEPSGAYETTYSEGYPRMRAAIPLMPGQIQALVISLFDQGDGAYDSAVILDGLRILEVTDPSTDCVGGIAPGGLSISPTATGP